MNDKNYLLAIDNGTQSVRALLFDLQGNLLGKGKVELEAYYSKHPGWAEQDPEYYWAMLGEACRRLWDQVDIDRGLIRGVSLTTQRGTVIHVDAEGRPLRPAILWLDQRRAEVRERIRGPWGWLFKLVGAEGAVEHFRAQAEVNWVAQEQPEIAAKTDKVLLLSGFLSHRLTGRFVDSVGCCVAYLPFDYKRLRWAAPRDWKWQALAVRREQLPELFKPGERLGEISAEASRHTGIPQGLPLIAAGADKACEVLGAGALEPTIACLSYGTTATINTTRARYLETVPLIPPYPAAIPDHFNTEVMIYRGYWMVNWFKREFGLREMQQAREQGVEPEQLFDELVNGVPPGSMGLTLQPYWSPGIREPGLEAKGGDDRFRRRAYPGTHLPGHPRGPGLCPAPGQGAHREAFGHADRAPARGRRRLAERRGDATHRRHLRPAGRAPACLRGVRPGCGDRLRGGARPLSGRRQRGGRDDPRRPGFPAPGGGPADLPAALWRGLPAHVSPVAPALPQHSRDYRLPCLNRAPHFRPGYAVNRQRQGHDEGFGSMDKDKVLLVLHGKQAGNEEVRAAVAAQREAGRELAVRVTWEDGDARRIVEEALAAGYATLVAGGGDGTLREVAEALARGRGEASLAILPLGTANDFARAAGIPLEPAAALALLDQTARPIDLGEVNGKLFLNMATGGFGSKVTANTSEDLKKVLGGAAYLLTGLTRFSEVHAAQGRFSAPDFQWEGEFLALGIGNGRQAGGGHVLCPQARVDDGLLDVSILPTPQDMVGTLGTLLGGGNGVESLFVRARVPWLEVEAAEGLDVNLDGEPLEGRKLRFSVSPGALRVHLPAGSPLLREPPRED